MALPFAVIFDWFLEPLAIRLGFWKWDGEIPVYNYICWFVISLLLLALFHLCKFNKTKQIRSKFVTNTVSIFPYFKNISFKLKMNWILYILIILSTFIIMEGITWLTHRYVMHGFLWYLHKDHHQKGPGFFEKNDAFFFIFAIPSWLLSCWGAL